MDVGKIILGTFVNVDSGVNVLLSVGVKVSVDGNASWVCADAASAVWTMYVLMAFGSSGGTGAATDGAHAITKTSATNQKKIFLVEFIILLRSLSHVPLAHLANGL